MHEVGFEPTKRFASDLKSDPFDQTRVPMPLWSNKVNNQNKNILLNFVSNTKGTIPLLTNNKLLENDTKEHHEQIPKNNFMTLKERENALAELITDLELYHINNLAN